MEIRDKISYDNNFVHGLHSCFDWNQSKSVKKYTFSKFFSTFTSLRLPLKLHKGKESTDVNPWFITGFIDAEGCFSIRVRKTTKTRIGWHVEAVFSICLHLRDLPLLQEIQTYFGGIGRITKGKKLCIFCIFYRRSYYYNYTSLC